MGFWCFVLKAKMKINLIYFIIVNWSISKRKILIICVNNYIQNYYDDGLLAWQPIVHSVEKTIRHRKYFPNKLLFGMKVYIKTIKLLQLTITIWTGRIDRRSRRNGEYRRKMVWLLVSLWYLSFSHLNICLKHWEPLIKL